MLSAEELMEIEFEEGNCDNITSNPYPNFKLQFYQEIIRLMKLYRNQGIQQASEVCSEMLTDGFRISNIPAVLALKEEV